jgi:hypothetical protein
MATVRDLSGNTPPNTNGQVDKKYETPNRSNAGTPVAALTPQYSGEIVLDTTNRQLWYAFGTGTNDWMPAGFDVN